MVNTGLCSMPYAVLFALLYGSAVSQPSGPVVNLGYAQYQGFYNETTNATNFLGIRFAVPPTGSLRFAAPQPPANATGVQQATEQPNQCFQASSGASPTNPLHGGTSASVTKRAVVQDEDCLFLDVYTPGTSLNTSLPVLFYIHGGGYDMGSADTPGVGSDFMKEFKHGIVIVAIQYRLGLFGFLPGQAVKAGGALNAGLLDQNFALKWTQSHIASFGGDPTKVTIWGSSAGAGSVLQHVVAHGGETTPPLFRGAITSSTYLPSQYKFNERVPELLYSEVVSQSNCSSSKDTLACLRAAPAETLETINQGIELGGFYGTFSFVPVVDGSFIVERPTVTLAKGKHNAEHFLGISNTFEGSIFVNITAPSAYNVTAYIMDLFPNITPQKAAHLAAQYNATGLTSPEQVVGAMGESIFICPTYYLLSAFKDAVAFKGKFAIPPGAHGSDVPFFLPSVLAPSYNNSDFINAFSQVFPDFITSLNPNTKLDPTITPSWNEYKDGHTEMLFNKTEADVPVIKPVKSDPGLVQRCASWNSVGELIGH